jgi:hypothetical protein
MIGVRMVGQVGNLSYPTLRHASPMIQHFNFPDPRLPLYWPARRR